MDKLLEAQTRVILGKKVKNLRQSKFIPAVIYGPKSKPQVLQILYNQFEKIYHHSGMGSLINLKVDQHEPIQALIQDVQFDPKSDQIQHIDFYKVRKGEKFKTSVKLNFVGEAKIVKESGAVLIKNLDEVEVECLPQNLPSEILVDISRLKNFDDLIKIKDLAVGKDVEVLNNPEDVVVIASQPEVEEAPLTPSPEEAAATQPESASELPKTKSV